MAATLFSCAKIGAMDLGLTDRAFVVTAASSGLGRATARELVAEGANVVLVALTGCVIPVEGGALRSL